MCKDTHDIVCDCRTGEKLAICCIEGAHVRKTECMHTIQNVCTCARLNKRKRLRTELVCSRLNLSMRIIKQVLTVINAYHWTGAHYYWCVSLNRCSRLLIRIIEQVLTVIDAYHLLDDELVHGLRGRRPRLAAGCRLLDDRRALANVMRNLLFPEAVSRIQVVNCFHGYHLHVSWTTVALCHWRTSTRHLCLALPIRYKTTMVYV